MGQNACCAQQPATAYYNKPFSKNATSVPLTDNGAPNASSQQEAQAVLAPIVRKRMKELVPYKGNGKRVAPKGQFKDAHVKMSVPQGYYYGEWKDGRLHGMGEMYFLDGSYYKGTFEDGNAEGDGRYIFNSGCVYEGQIFKNEANGAGTYEDQFQGYKYVGEWMNDVPHGKGRENFSNGSYYEGSFFEGVKNGYGHYVCHSGVYEGQFRNGSFEGTGTFKYVDDRKYKGEWKGGLIQGYGVFSWPDGNKYQGLYAQGLKHGTGKFLFANGKVFKGNWRRGLKHGPGALQIGTQVITGNWYDGELQTD